jgi:hypothetical protein
MSLLLIILIVLLLVGVPGGWRYGGPYAGVASVWSFSFSSSWL